MEKDRGAPPKLEVRAERWTVDDLDFLELSVVADIEDARKKQAGLAEYVSRWISSSASGRTARPSWC
jgi:hypothetical protein